MCVPYEIYSGEQESVEQDEPAREGRSPDGVVEEGGQAGDGWRVQEEKARDQAAQVAPVVDAGGGEADDHVEDDDSSQRATLLLEEGNVFLVHQQEGDGAPHHGGDAGGCAHGQSAFIGDAGEVVPAQASNQINTQKQQGAPTLLCQPSHLREEGHVDREMEEAWGETCMHAYTSINSGR